MKSDTNHQVSELSVRVNADSVRPLDGIHDNCLLSGPN